MKFTSEIAELEHYQETGAIPYLFALFMACRQKYLDAARLLEVNNQKIQDLVRFGAITSVDMGPLLDVYSLLSKRYRNEVFNPQVDLLIGSSENEKWANYYHQAIIPQLLNEDSVVRNILRTTGTIPSVYLDEATASLLQHVNEMDLPTTSS